MKKLTTAMRQFRESTEIPSFEKNIEFLFAKLCGIFFHTSLDSKDSRNLAQNLAQNPARAQNLTNPTQNTFNPAFPRLFKLFRVCFIILVDCILAFAFCAPLYGLHLFESVFGREIPLFLGSILGVLSIYVYLRMPKSRRFGVGFFVGIFCFYWVGLSFRFIGLSALVPIVSIAVALIYGVIFWFIAFCECLVVRLLGLLLLGFIAPFGFDWLNVQSFLAYSYFDVDFLHFTLLVCALYCFIAFTRARLIIGALCLIFALDFKTFRESSVPKEFENIALVSTNVPQEFKWSAQKMQEIVIENFAHIYEAKNNDKRVVVLPENAFPLSLEADLKNYPSFYELLLNLSKEITIITGALSVRDSQYYNSLFVFADSQVLRVDKVVLAPFGEYVPLPAFVKKAFPLLEELEFSRGKDFGDISLLGYEFRVGICYEATDRALYRDYPRYVLAISNNAWFYPSIEPTLQKMLLKYYARRFDSVILHAANGSESFIITP
ncbi:apolipoprotein N-acyltransferase [Helicobacter sp. MIT 00-7814]|uniref:apolipoprotein N-acyltransferase n=1 Tax=unclassified Helicobacter TaxID=2593540 RepID=UPI000E1F3630|nr:MULTISPECIES: apolipoprotein N-acyltransferase [unclassified Helicobacter]RDU55112.1 apolipoprotein N-acyltransferase [Helicobacter sp. MIT 99-10781]RDU56931.1 apolipoprotein N-acyltransferase [Helicobacter sp. MIT 00-7814]